MSSLTIDMPRKHRHVLFAKETAAGMPVRWRGLKGGRDSAKSHSAVKAAIARCISARERVVCTREVQKSLADSLHQLICDQISFLGVRDFFDVRQNYIAGPHESQFSFHGLSNQTAGSIKSLEGATIALIEEGQTVSARSLDILVPTIRAENSEIWACWNPEMETDAIDQRLVVNCPDDAIVEHVNYTDNPWASKALDSDREQMQRTDPEKFAHVYLGQYRPAVEGAIYYNEVSALKANGRLTNVPYDPLLKVHWIWDLGYNDYMSILGVQRMASEVRVIAYIEDRLRTYDSYSQELKDFKWNNGKLWIPHDGKARSAESGRNAQQILEALGWTVEIVPDVGIEQGIKLTRMLFPRLYVDKTRAGEWMTRMGRYRRHVNKTTGTGSAPVHDEHSHGADAGRYLSVVADQLTNENPGKALGDVNSYFRSRRHG